MATADCIDRPLLSYYQTNGATSDDLQDAEREFLLTQGALPASNKDMWYTMLRSLGYTGTVQDMLNTFWCRDEGSLVPSYWNTSYEEVDNWDDAYDLRWDESYNTELP